MSGWAHWLFLDRRNRFAWLAAIIQTSILIAGQEADYWSNGVASALTQTALGLLFIVLGMETASGTKRWNGPGRSLTVLSFVMGFVFVAPAYNSWATLAIGEYQPPNRTPLGQFLRDVSLIVAIFAPVSTLTHLRHLRTVRNDVRAVQLDDEIDGGVFVEEPDIPPR